MNKKLRFCTVFNKFLTTPAAALIIAFVICGIILKCLGYQAFEAYGALFKGAFGNAAGIARTLAQFTPVMFTGLAYTIAMKAKVVNLGAEGQFVGGGMAAALAGVYLPTILPYPIGFIIPLMIGVIAGALLGGFPALLNRQFRADIMLLSLMLNYIIILITNWMTKGPFQGEGANPATAIIKRSAEIPLLKSNSQLHLGFILALLAAVAFHIFLYKTPAGMEYRIVGLNPGVASYKGINRNKVIMRAMLISGGIAGMGGACMVLGVYHNFMVNMSPGYGWDGVAASLLGAGEPLTTAFGAFVFGAMRSGSVYLGRTTKIPSDFIFVIEGILIMFIVTPYLLKRLSIKEKKEEK